MIAGRDIHVTLGDRQVLDGIDIRIDPGRVTALIGPNGAGKSTLLRVLAGLLKPGRGRVSLEDRDLADLGDLSRARAIGYLPQAPEVHWRMTVREVVGLGRLPWIGRFSGLSREDEAAIDAALVAADLAALVDRPVDRISGGEYRRAMLARVLAGTPRILIADEPATGLDPHHQLRLVRLLRATAAGGTAVVVVLHDLALAGQVADDIVLIDAGVIRAAGRPADILTTDHLEPVYGVSFLIVEAGGKRLPVPLDLLDSTLLPAEVPHDSQRNDPWSA